MLRRACTLLRSSLPHSSLSCAHRESCSALGSLRTGLSYAEYHAVPWATAAALPKLAGSRVQTPAGCSPPTGQQPLRLLSHGAHLQPIPLPFRQLQPASPWATPPAAGHATRPPQACTRGYATAAPSKTLHVMARSFLLGSYIDLAKLMPRFADVICASGKDYIVLAFSPASLAVNQRIDALAPEDAGHTNLPPEQTYFVVFRYGAVVLFQGFDDAAQYSQYMRQSNRQLQVSAPAKAAQQMGGFENPWETSAETWRHAAKKDHDGELIYLLLRPFISESSDGILFEPDILPSNSTSAADTLDDRVFSRPLQHSSSDRASPLLYKESVHMIINPDQENFIVQKPDVFYLKQLDVGTLRCVASALGQSSALDFYSQKVDAALKEAEKATKEMAQTGMFKQKNVNFQSMIGYCSLIHSAVISQIGLLDKNDLAWQYAKYDKMLELLRAEFDLEKRLKNLEAKIAVVAGTASIFLGIQQHAKSNFLEWLIVFLIAAEILVSLYDMFWHSRHEAAAAGNEAAPAPPVAA